MKNNGYTFMFSRIASRIQRRSLKDVVDSVVHKVANENVPVVAFTNGISPYSFMRLLALHLINQDHFDFKRRHGLIRDKRERIAVEDAVDMLVEDFSADKNLTVVSDVRWASHPMRAETYAKIMDADSVYEISRPRQEYLDMIAREVENGATAAEILELSTSLSETAIIDKTPILFGEYRYVDTVLYAMTSRDMRTLLSKPSVSDKVRDFIRYLLDLPYDVPLLSLI